MSLNGLDSRQVLDAYRKTIADPSGWFLLHYKSRDELDVLSQGTGGYTELLVALTVLEGSSPIYGLFRYRRRKVLLKYVPDGVSRLQQARVSVHYKTIVQHYTHDVEFSISSPREIDESALASLCSLHAEETSSASLRSRNLSDITENAEPQSNNPEVSSILARLRANKQSQERANLNGSDNNADTSAGHTPGISQDLSPSDFLDPTQAAFYISQNSSKGTTPRGVSPLKSDQKDYFTREKPRAPTTTPPKSPERDIPETFVRPPSPGPYKDIDDSYRFPQSPIHDAEARSLAAESKRSFASWKPKLKLFPRPATSEALADPKRDNTARQKLPSSIRIAFQRVQSDTKSTKSEKPTKSKKSKKSEERVEKLHPPLPIQQSPSRDENGKQSPPQTAPVAAASTPDLDKLRLGPLPSPPSISTMMALDSKKATPNTVPQSDKVASSPVAIDSISNASSVNTASMGVERARLMKALLKRNQHLYDALGPMPDIPKDSDLDNIVGRSNQTGPRSNAEARKELGGVKADAFPRADAKGTSETNGKLNNQRQTEIDSGIALEGINGRAILPKTNPGRQTPTSGATGGVEIVKAEEKTPIHQGSQGSPGKQPFVSVFSTQQLSNGVSNTREPASASPDDQSKLARAQQRQSTRSRRISRDPSRKRKSKMNAVRGSILRDDSDGFTSDDSLMEELQFATLEEAQQIALPQSPGSPAEGEPNHSRKPTVTTVTTVRSVVVPGLQGQLGQDSNPSLTQLKELRAPHPPRKSLDRPVNGNKRVNASVDISRRMHTLAEMSNQESKAQVKYVQTSAPRMFLAAQQQQASSTVGRGSSSTLPMKQPASTSRVTTPVPGQGQAQPSTRAMSITARIVRPNASEGGDVASTRGAPSLDLQQSELTIQEERGETGERGRSPSKLSFRRVERPPSLTSRPESRGSVFSNRSKRSFDMGLNFWSSRNGTETSPQGRSEVPPSINNLETVEEVGEERNKSRTSRLFRRMSGLGKVTGTTASTATRRYSGSKAALSGCIVGDLNVQFPDTLLWKRRWVEIDHSGFLILSATTNQERQRSAPRRYHLTELKRPVIPSQDGQELPYSILFDLTSGGTLQLACEDPISQGQVLKRLSDSHNAWINNG